MYNGYVNIICAISVALLCAKPAAAEESASSEFIIEGTAQPVCHVSPPTSSNANNVSFSGSTITVNNLIDQNDATVQPWSVRLQFAQVMCNYNASVTIHSENGGLVPVDTVDNVVAGSGEFLTRVDYVIDANWGTVTLPQLNTASGQLTTQEEAGGPNQADLILVISMPGASKPLVQAQYQDTIKIKVGLTM